MVVELSSWTCLTKRQMGYKTPPDASFRFINEMSILFNWFGWSCQFVERMSFDV